MASRKYFWVRHLTTYKARTLHLLKSIIDMAITSSHTACSEGAGALVLNTICALNILTFGRILKISVISLKEKKTGIK